jgi:hypothetical protein
MTRQELTEEIIASLKEQVSNRPLYKKTLFGQDFVFTYINREEYAKIQRWIDENGQGVRLSDIEEKIVDYALLWPQLAPPDWATLPAGAIPTLAKHIQEKSYLDASGMNDFEDLDVEDLTEMPTVQVLTDKDKEALKKKYSYPMRAVTIGNSTYVIRPMLRPEYSSLQKLPREMDGEVEGVKRCLIWPENVDWSATGAGVPTILAAQIMLLSGFSDPSKVEEL